MRSMNDFFMIHMYLSKKDFKLVSYKKTKIGFYIAEEPYKIFPVDCLEKVVSYITEMFYEIEKQPIANSVTSNLMKNALGVKNFKQFSKNHLCIVIKFYAENGEFVVNNECRLSDGSFGQTKGITDGFCTEYKCEEHQYDRLLENIRLALEDGKRFLAR